MVADNAGRAEGGKVRSLRDTSKTFPNKSNTNAFLTPYRSMLRWRHAL